ncbi:hypothetical protein AB1Y20_014534 [Prymnesium parvum]|uniref:Uncharacterized protein n=1 Tax=Prymnesium parvum TaxID=97485 RepID=A0AB34IEF6_PRYPA
MAGKPASHPVAPMARVAFMVGHDDDEVLDPKVTQRSRALPERTSAFTGLQSDLAIVECISQNYPQFNVCTLFTVEDLLTTDAKVVIIISYRTQTSFHWYNAFFTALRSLESRGVIVYPRADFKEFISSKSRYMHTLRAAHLCTCPTEVINRVDCVDEFGVLQPCLVEAQLRRSLKELGMIGEEGSFPNGLPLVTKPSNADGGFGVAFWEGSTPPSREDENTGEELSSEAYTSGASGRTYGVQRTHPRTLDQLRCVAMLTCGCDMTNDSVALRDSPTSNGVKRTRGEANRASTASREAYDFYKYVREVALSSERPHLLLQPLVPELAHNFEVKIYFLCRRLFYAVLTYGKERQLAKVLRPTIDHEIFAFLEPLVQESRRALDALPPDGKGDPKILMRVDWGSLAPPMKKLKAAMAHGSALVGEPGGYFINEVELHPGFFVDWDSDPDKTIVPLAHAYGAYIQSLLVHDS